MSVSFESALAQLKAMFPTFDKEVITMVLRSHNGHMERTVEALLTMQGENESAMASAARGGGGGGGGRGAVGGGGGGSGGGKVAAAAATTASSGRGVKAAAAAGAAGAGAAGAGSGAAGDSILPADFLRVPGGWPRPRPKAANRRASWTGLSAEQQAAKLAQEHQDRILAEALQNEMFTRQLQQMPEFRGFVDQAGRIRQRDARGRIVSRPGAPAQPSAAAAAASASSGEQKNGGGSAPTHRRASSGSSVSSLFSSLGSELQNKFNLLALQFQSKSSGKAKASDGNESENYSLLSDGSDEDAGTGAAKPKASDKWGEGEMIELSPTKGSRWVGRGRGWGWGWGWGYGCERGSGWEWGERESQIG